MSPVLENALSYLDAGLSVIAVRANGTKAPLHAGWREFTTRRATRDEAASWFHPDIVCGIGITGGPASGNLAVLDFETWAAYESWFRALTPAQQQLTRSCPLVQAPRGGAHLYVRLTDPVPGTVLARHLVDGAPKTLIEVRGDGEQVVAPGSPPQCHPLQKEYEWLRRGWLDATAPVAPIPLDEWFDWIEKAAALNEYTPPAADRKPVPPAKSRPTEAGIKPGADFNARGTWEETGLFAAGWSWFQELDGDRGFVTRPGKARKDGKSGTVGMVSAKDGGHPLFYAFTSDCAPFEPKKGYSKFRVYAILQHESDWEAAARALGQRGYGDQSRGHKGPAVAFTGGLRPPPQSEGGRSVEGETNSGQSEPPAKDAAGNALPLIYYDEIGPALDSADFVEGLLIDGTMSVIYGESNCGKTFFTLDLALHVAAGLPWRGREVDRRGVLYLALEGKYGISNRIAAFKAQNNNAADIALAVVPVSVDLFRPDGDVLRVIEAAKAAAERLSVPVGLIVVDTLARAMAGGNENSPEDMGALVRNLDLIRQALPSHVAVVHHSGKDVARGARGHSSLRAATDTEIEVTRDHAARTSLAKVTKQRDLPGDDEFAFRLGVVELGHNRRGKPVTSCVVVPADTEGVPKKEDKAAQAERLKLQKQRDQDAHDERAVLLVIDAEAAQGYPGASMGWIEDHADCGRLRAKKAVLRLYERGELITVHKFEKRIGNNATREVPTGYGRPAREELE